MTLQEAQATIRVLNSFAESSEGSAIRAILGRRLAKIRDKCSDVHPCADHVWAANQQYQGALRLWSALIDEGKIAQSIINQAEKQP